MKYLVGLIMMTMLWCSTAHAQLLIFEGRGEVVSIVECEKAAKEGHFLHSVVNEKRSTFWYRVGEPPAATIYKQHFEFFGDIDGDMNAESVLSCRKSIETR